jgi:UDP-N-acetylmuramate dehydrogenase
MMAANLSAPHLIDRLPRVRGRLTADAPLAAQTWFRVGGAAEVLFKPADRDDLAAFLNELPADVPLTIIGATSNLLIRDGGIPGVTIRLGGSFSAVDLKDDYLIAGAGALDTTVSRHAADIGRGGLEFLSGIPGTIGGAVAMNAGAYESEIKDVLIDAEIMQRDGLIVERTATELSFSYRNARLPSDGIVLSARLRTKQEDQGAIEERMREIETRRSATQPVRARTGGSTFANPQGQKAWQLIEAAGCRGFKVGGAEMSEKHCNFMINTGSATATDLENLGKEVRARVVAASGITLRWEIRRVGVKP